MDAINLTLQDRDGRVWQGDKWPRRGDELEPVIVTKNWRKQGDRHELRCGLFELDEPDVNGPPDIITLKGTAKMTKGAAQTTKHTQGWEDVNLSDVADELAERNGYELLWLGSDWNYPRLDQMQEGDLAFLSRLAKDVGNGVKIYNKTMEIRYLVDLENQKPSFVFNRLQSFKKGKAVENYHFKSGLHGRYKYCHVAWQATDKGEVYYGDYEDDKEPSGEMLFISDKRVASDGEAATLAKEMLRMHNRPDITATLSVVGDTDILGGLTCDLEEFGGFSGKYLIKSAEHSPFNGYRVRLNLQKVKK